MVKNIDVVIIVCLIIDEIIFRYGVLWFLFLDCGKNFFFNIVKEVCNLYSIKKLNISAYNSVCDGLVERFNFTLC